MAIADYPQFRTSDTMDRQVTKLVEFVSDVDTNITALSSSLSSINSIYNYENKIWNYSDTVTTNATGNITFNPTLNFNVNSTLTNIISLDSAKIAGKNIDIVATGTIIGTGRMTFKSGVDDVLVLNGTGTTGTGTTDATFSGTITMPTNSVNTTAKDVAGAINELRAAIVSLGGTFP